MRPAALSAALLACISISSAQYVAYVDSNRAVRDSSRNDTVALNAAYAMIIYGAGGKEDLDVLGLKIDAALADGDPAVRAVAERYRVEFLYFQGGAYLRTRDYAHSVRAYQQAITLEKGRKDTLGTSYAHHNLGYMYENIGEMPRALNAYKESLRWARMAGEKNQLAIVLTRIGSVMAELNAMDSAVSYLNAGMQLMDSGGHWLVLRRLALVRAQQGDTLEALRLLDRSLLSCPLCLGPLLSKAKILRGQGQFASALAVLDKCLEFSLPSDNLYNQAICFIELGRVRLAMNDRKGAETDLLSGLRMAEEGEHVEEIIVASRMLTDLYKEAGRKDEALVMLEHWVQMNDSAERMDAEQDFLLLDFEREQLQDSLANAEARHTMELSHQQEVAREKNRRNVLLFSGIGVLLLAGGLWGRLRYTNRAKRAIEKEKAISEELLLNILPEEVAEELKAKGHADAKHFDLVTILFTDFKGFTSVAELLSPAELVEELNICFKAFDYIITARGIEKIKTIGDAYMCAGGLPVPASSTPAGVVHAALEMQTFMIARKKERDAQGKPAFEMRVGIHTGPVVAGIVGVKKFAYDIWGDTVNIASRMESSGEVGQVNISESTYRLLVDGCSSSDDPPTNNKQPATTFTFTPRGKVQAKGKGEMEMYFVRP